MDLHPQHFQRDGALLERGGLAGLVPLLDGLDDGEAAVVELLLRRVPPFGPPGRIQLLDGGTRSTAEGPFAPEGRPVKFVPDRLAGGVDLTGGSGRQPTVRRGGQGEGFRGRRQRRGGRWGSCSEAHRLDDIIGGGGARVARTGIGVGDGSADGGVAPRSRYPRRSPRGGQFSHRSRSASLSLMAFSAASLDFVAFITVAFDLVDLVDLGAEVFYPHLGPQSVQLVVHDREGLLDLEVPGPLRSLAGGGEGPVGVRGEDIGLPYRVVGEERAEDDRILQEDGTEDHEEPQKP